MNSIAFQANVQWCVEGLLRGVGEEEEIYREATKPPRITNKQ